MASAAPPPSSPVTFDTSSSAAAAPTPVPARRTPDAYSRDAAATPIGADWHITPQEPKPPNE
jgi:hypothetical protein